MTRQELLERGTAHVRRWCELNGVRPPEISVQPGRRPTFGVCAFYRHGEIRIWPEACARIGFAGRQWSYPGYAVDRTPYGVLAHELGHHVEGAHGKAGGIVATAWRLETRVPRLTTYCPNDNEWFAEHFRLFVTNPGLSAEIAPALFALLIRRWPERAETRPWEEVLAGADRQLRAARNRIKRGRR